MAGDCGRKCLTGCFRIPIQYALLCSVSQPVAVIMSGFSATNRTTDPDRTVTPAIATTKVDVRVMIPRKLSRSNYWILYALTVR